MIAFDEEFPQDPGLVYLNHAAVAPWPRRTVEAVQCFALENLRSGAEGYAGWLRTEADLRARLARLVNAPSPGDVALLKNTSEGLSIVAHGLDWRPGDRVVISDQEFPSNRIVWESLRGAGVTVHEVPLAGDDPEQALIAALAPPTRLLAVSQVQYASGLRLDVERLGRACEDRGVRFCIDAIQAVGATALDVQACRADFAVADGHKWMLGPEGVALFYCRAERRDEIRLHQYGWHMVAEPGDYERRAWRPAPDARRFECGSPNMLGIAALHASVGLLLEAGLDEVHEKVSNNVSYLIDKSSSIPGITVLSDTRAGRVAGIVTVGCEAVGPERLFERLRARRVICARRGGGVRLSPHFYTPRERLDRALEILADAARA